MKHCERLQPGQETACKGSHKDIELLMVTAHYGEPALLQGLAKQVADLYASGVSCLKVAVCDNSEQMITPGEYRPLQIYRPGSNLGYLNGCCFALSQYLAAGNPIPKWIAVMNTDVVIPSETVAGILAFNPPSEIAVVGPDIRLPSGRPQNPYLQRRPSPFRMGCSRFILSRPFLMRLLELRVALKRRLTSRRHWPDRAENADAHCTTTYAVHGSVLFLSRIFFERGGTLAYPSFLYNEEVFIAEQVRRLGLKTLYCPWLHVLHCEHSTTSAKGLKTRTQWAGQSAEFIYNTYFSNNQFQ